MERLKKIGPVLITFLIFLTVLIAGTPTSTLIKRDVTAIASGGSQTITCANVTLEGDSIGFYVDFSVDSVSGYFTYDWVTPNGYTSSTSQTLTLSDGTTSFALVGSKKAVFSRNIVRMAGVPQIHLYLYMVNNKAEAASETITTNIGKVTWR